MTSMVLSKNTLKKAFGNGLSSDKCHHVINTECLERPKTAVPGKRRQFSDAPKRDEDKEMSVNSSNGINNNVCRPKTSYSDRGLPGNRSLCQSGKPRGNNCTNSVKILTEKDLEDIDIVEYFYDRSIKDIFPASNVTDVNNESQISINKHRMTNFDQSCDLNNQTIQTFDRTKRKGFSRIKRSQIQKKSVKNSEDGYVDRVTDEHKAITSKLMSEMPYENRYDTYLSKNRDDIDSFWQRKSNSLKEKTGFTMDSRRRLHSDTEVASSPSQDMSSDLRGRMSTKSKMEMKPDDQTYSTATNFGLHPPLPFEYERTNMRSKVISKYKHDIRILDHPKFSDQLKQQSRYSLGNPDSFQFKTNKYPRKLKPIPGSNNHETMQK